MFSKTKLKFDDIFENKLDESDVKNYLIEIYNRGESVEEIASAAKSMREHMVPVSFDGISIEELLDNCGTGGDHSNSFNISTTVSLLLSACGVKIAKHGNRSITSNSGSADMLEELGIALELSIENQSQMMSECGFTFLFAKNHHPSMKYIMPIRKSIAHRTIFNILGPLCNPANVQKQLIGVFNKEYVSKIANALVLLDSQRAMVVSSEDGMDEISISAITRAAFIENKSVNEFDIDPRKYGLKMYPKEEILGGNAKTNANITQEILSGRLKGAKRDIVLLNAGFALLVDGKVDSVEKGIEIAYKTIDSGKALEKLEKIISVSNKLKIDL